MDTSQDSVASYVLYIAVYVVALRALGRLVERTHGRWSPAALTLWSVVAVASIAGLASTRWYDALSREPGAIRSGEVWRLLTSVVVQDSGVVGTVYNLVTLGLVLPVALTVWRTSVAVALFVIGGVGFDLVATFAWNEAGGGNSAATFFLLTATLAVQARGRTRGALVATVVVAVLGVVLVAVDDAHGTAVLAGLVVGGLAAAFVTRRHGARGRPVGNAFLRPVGSS